MSTEDCIICYDGILRAEDILPCGHRVHICCVQKQFKAECPLCRHPLDMHVYGKRPEPNIDPPEDLQFVQGDVQGIIFGFYLPPGIVIEYNYETESFSEESDYDEENPHGDKYDYEDV